MKKIGLYLVLIITILIPKVTNAAITCTVLTSNISDTDATSYTTSSITPTSNSLILATFTSRVGAATPNNPTATGNGLTWVTVDNELYDNTGSQKKLTVLRAMGSTPSTGTITFDLAGQTQTGASWSISECSGTDSTGTNGSGAIVQVVSTNNGLGGATASSLTVTLGTFSNVENATWGSFGFGGVSKNPINGSGFTLLDVQSNFDSGENGQASLIQYLTSNDTSVDASTDGGSNTEIGGIAIEIAIGEEDIVYLTEEDMASTTAQIASLNFGLTIIIVLMFIGLTGFIWNSFNKKKKWQ